MYLGNRETFQLNYVYNKKNYKKDKKQAHKSTK